MIQIKPHVYSMGGSLIVGQNTSEQNMLRLERDLICGVEIKENTKSEDENRRMIKKTLKCVWWGRLAAI